MKNWYFRAFVLATLYAIDLVFRWLIVGVVAYPESYLAAMLAGGLTVGTLFALFRQSKVVNALMWLQVAWIFIHIFGLFLWLWFFPPDFYDGAQSVLNAVQIAIIIWAPNDDRDSFAGNFRRLNWGLRRFGLLRANYEGKNR